VTESEGVGGKPIPAIPTVHAIALSDTARDIETPEAVEEVDFEFSGPFFVGDCKLAAATLTIRSDGTASWRANEVTSTAGDDSWGARFEFFDNHGISLWLHGWIWSPSLSPPFADITWVSDHELFFPGYLFPFVASVTMHMHC
jgi:Family of unknown function (DUF6294)